MRYCVILLFLSFFITQNSNAQSSIPKRKCGSETDWVALKANPEKWQQFQLRERNIKDHMRQIQARIANEPSTTYEIPVVFHIVDGRPDTITNERIQFQLDVLNRDYAGSNDDSTNATGFYNIRGHSRIKFVLARRSPDGCDTNGITRTVSNLVMTGATATNIKYTALGGHDAWDSYNCHYLNIWTGNFGVEADGSKLLGIATFPDGSEPAAEQGVIVGNSTFLRGPGACTQGRTLVHEVGHFFNLFHIWGDASGCATDDGVNDTPLQDSH